MKPLSIIQTLNLARQFVSQAQTLLKMQYLDRKDLESYQLQRINIILNAAKKTPLYKNDSRPKQIESLEEIKKFPVLKKEDLLGRETIDRINSDFKAEDLVVSKSSGSTGRALDVYYDIDSYNFFILAGLRLYFMAFKYMPWHRQTYIYTSPYPIHSLFGAYPLRFISTLNPISDTIEDLKKNPPDLLVCYPSHLRAIAAQMSTEDFKVIRPKAINVNSEMSTQTERDYLSKKFQSFVFDDYSSEELTRIASQCKYHNYHIFEDLNYIEILDDNNEPVPEGVIGNIVGTNLHNIGMPLIRYAQGDRGSIRTKLCPCGRTFKILEALEGRKNDAFELSNGEVISSGYLLDLTYGVFLDYPGAVSAFCLVQEQPEEWVLELVPGEKWSSDLEFKIPGSLKKQLNRSIVNIKSKIVREVQKTKSGKSNPIISKINKNQGAK